MLSGKRFYRTVFMLGAEAEMNDKGEFVIASHDRGLPQLADWRIDAAKALYKLGMVDKFVIVGGEKVIYVDDVDEVAIYRYEVMKNLLINGENAVPEYKVESVLDRIGSTKGNVKEIAAYIQSHNLLIDECAFLTNFYHIPRAILFLHEAGLFLRPLAAESFILDKVHDILTGYGCSLGSGFDARLLSEITGIRHKEMGLYI